MKKCTIASLMQEQTSLLHHFITEIFISIYFKAVGKVTFFKPFSVYKKHFYEHYLFSSSLFYLHLPPDTWSFYMDKLLSSLINSNSLLWTSNCDHFMWSICRDSCILTSSGKRGSFKHLKQKQLVGIHQSLYSYKYRSRYSLCLTF